MSDPSDRHRDPRNRRQPAPTLEQREAEYIDWGLKRTDGNRTRAGQILGIDRGSLWWKLKKYGLEETEG